MLHVGQPLINLNPVKSAWRYQDLSMTSSKGALISLTFPVIISMPTQPPTIYQQRTKEATLKLCSWIENILLIDVFKQYMTPCFVPRAPYLHNS